MEQTVVRIIYDPATKRAVRFIKPHMDAHLNAHPPLDGEAHLDITNEDWASLQAPFGPHLDVIETYIRSKTGG